MDYQNITQKIIGCAYRVYNKMGFGFLESVYEKCMLIELNKQQLTIESQKPLKVFYEQYLVGEYVADIVVNDTIIVELKSVKQIVRAHEIQLVNYLVATGKPVGLLLNFGEKRVEVKRKVKDLNNISTYSWGFTGLARQFFNPFHPVIPSKNYSSVSFNREQFTIFF